MILRWVDRVSMLLVISLESIVEALLELLVVGFGAVSCEKTTSLGQVVHTVVHFTHAVDIWSKLEVGRSCVLD